MAKTDTLFVTEVQCAERLGLSLEQFKVAELGASKEGFPPKDVLFANRRYWPAVKAWLDRRYDLIPGATQLGIDGKENWEKATSASRRRS